MKLSKKTLSIILSIIGVCALTAAGILFVHGVLEDRHSQETLEALRASAQEAEQKAAAEADSTDTAADTATPDPSGAKVSDASGASDAFNDTNATDALTSAPPSVVNPYADSFLANQDMAAWLEIPDTNIDYPVMWTPEDESYYLYRDFDGTSNKNGCLILDTDSSLDPLTTNLIIHGHNMRSGAMFGNLTDYEDEAFYQNHKQIILYTEECQRNYEVIAVFRSQVFKKSEEVFKFYKFFQADTQEEFDDFYQNIKELSLYDTGVTAQFGDHFLTLSTCVYHVENGRFVVVAREVESGDSYLPVQE